MEEEKRDNLALCSRTLLLSNFPGVLSASREKEKGKKEKR